MIGWYHSGPKLRSSDLEINELFKRYTPNPVLVIIDVKPNDAEIPTDAYFAIEEIKDVSFLYLYCNEEMLNILKNRMVLVQQRLLCMFHQRL